MRQLRQSVGGLGNILFKQALIISQVLDGKIPDVYVQGKKFWGAHEKTIKDYFSEGVGYTDAVAIHIRRGDYLKADNFHVNLWPTGYYQKALQLFPQETRFIIFCKDRQDKEQDERDKQWCAENIPGLLGGGRGWEFPPEGTEVDDLNLMASCKGLIMANSSFSWFGAFLGSHKKIVTCPKENKWYVDGQVRTEVLPNWIQIDV